MLQEICAGTAGLCLRRQSQPAKPWQLRPPQIAQEFLCFVGGDLQRSREPQQQAAIDQRVADDEHEDDRQKRNGHGADDHLRLKASAELFSAAFHPETQDSACEDQAKDEKSGGDKTGDSVEHHHGAPALGLKWYVERSEGEDGGQEQRQKYSADGETPALFAVQSAHQLTIIQLRGELCTGHGKPQMPLTPWTFFVSGVSSSAECVPVARADIIFGTIASVQRQVKISTCSLLAGPAL